MINIMIIPTLLSIFCVAPSGDSGEATRLFWVTYKSHQSTESARKEAIHGLSSHPTLAGVKILGKLLLAAPGAHRIEAAKALSKFRGIYGASCIAARALQHPANKRRSAIRVELIKTLVSLKENGTLRVIHNLIKDKDFRVSQAAINAIPAFQRKRSVQLLINALKKSEKNGGMLGRKRTKALNIALSTLTGRPLANSREWSRWWGSMAVRTNLH